MFDNKIIFITGWTWTWWNAITTYLLNNFNVNKIIIYSRSEDKQVMMQNKFCNDKLKFILWDIRDSELLIQSTRWVDYIIHLAALKHITKCLENPSEAISININWTQNIINSALINNVKKVLYISTDKAVEPYNLYWNTKAIWEKLISEANNNILNKNTVFFTLRAGNILWSNWSVLKIFYNQILKNNSVTITNFNMKRFYILISDILSLILFSFKHSIWWEIYVPICDVLSLKDLLKIFLKSFDYKDINVKEIWIKKWEKIDEVLISNSEVNNTYILEEVDAYFIDTLLIENKNNKKVNFTEYSTKTNYFEDDLNEDKFREYIKSLF